LSSPLADIANLGGMARNANPINQTIQALQPYLFFAKIYHQTARCGPTLQMLKEVEAHTICPKGKLACRHLIHMIETYRPGDTLPLETTVPDAVAINPNTFRPETDAELREDPTINHESIPDTPHRNAASTEPPTPACGAMAQALAGLASMNTVPEAQHPTLLTLYQHECAVQMEKEKQLTADRKMAAMIEKKAAMIETKAAMIETKAAIAEETKKIEAATKLLSLPNSNLLRCLEATMAQTNLSATSLEEMARDARQAPLQISGRGTGPCRRRIGDTVFVNSPTLVDDGEIVVSGAHPDRPLRVTRREVSVREILEEEVSRMQAEDTVRPTASAPTDTEEPATAARPEGTPVPTDTEEPTTTTRPEGTPAPIRVSAVSKRFRGVARELVRTAYHRANTVAQNPGTEGEGCWYPLIKNTTIPAKDLEALAATNRGMIFLGEFDKSTVPRKRLRKYDNVVGKTALDGVVAVLALVKSKRSRRTLKTRIYRAPEIH